MRNEKQFEDNTYVGDNENVMEVEGKKMELSLPLKLIKLPWEMQIMPKTLTLTPPVSRRKKRR